MGDFNRADALLIGDAAALRAWTAIEIRDAAQENGTRLQQDIAKAGATVRLALEAQRSRALRDEQLRVIAPSDVLPDLVAMADAMTRLAVHNDGTEGRARS